MMKTTLATTFGALVLAGCATTAPPPEERHPQDPWEPYNRNVYQFNSTVDRAVIRPLAIGYGKVTPKPARRGIRNFFTNIYSPVTIVNLILQGRGGDAGTQFQRFFVNTVFGIGGLFDIASAGGLEDHDEDFGQTLAVWGWDESRYFILPFLGPSTVRDGLGRVPDYYANIAWRYAREESSFALLGLNVVQLRHAMLPLDEDIEAAFDPYSFVRDSWLQRRSSQIGQGETTLPDYESFLDDGRDDGRDDAATTPGQP